MPSTSSTPPACGRARSADVGLELPVLAMEHQYLVTGEMPRWSPRRRRCSTASTSKARSTCARRPGHADRDLREEGRAVAEKSTPWDFTHELLPPDLERIAPSLEVGFRHFPALERAGSSASSTGRSRSPPTQSGGRADPGPPNYWVAVASWRIFPGGGVGLALANWMVHGDPVRRLGDGRRPLRRLGNARVHQRQGARKLLARFRIRFPNEELPAARPLRMTPVYDRLKAKGAVFGAAFGLEHACGSRPPASSARGRHLPALERAPLRRNECRSVRNAVGCSRSRPSPATR